MPNKKHKDQRQGFHQIDIGIVCHAADKRINDADDQNACQPKADGCRQADTTIDIADNIAVVPPVSVKKFFQRPGSRIFQNDTAKEADQKDL